jgi:cell division GTPase FtsZ
MKPCVVGIGGAGGNILKQFLQSMDANLVVHQFGEILSFGDVKGIWLESASQDAQKQDYYGDVSRGCYPGYLICHEMMNDSSSTVSYVMDIYGLNLKAPGFDRRAEYLKAVFEVFESDSVLKTKCSDEFEGYSNPLSGYMWKIGIRPLTIISIGKNAEDSKPKDANDKSSTKISFSNPISKIRTIRSKKISKLCDSILFLASLGGGTGTGFINPITNYVRSENLGFPIFALGVLTEMGSDERHAAEGKRFLGATIAMYDLLTKETGTGIDGLILVDNQIMVEKYERNYSAMDKDIYSAFKPLLDLRNYPGYSLQDDSLAIRGVIGGQEVEVNSEVKNDTNKKTSNKIFPPMLVPCYCIRPDHESTIETLVDGALGKQGSIFPLGKDDGRLFPCDPSKADRALVFTRGFFSLEEILKTVQSRTGLLESKIKIYRKLGDSKNNDILILLRNPYGGNPGEHERPGTLEWKLHKIIKEAINYIEQNQANIIEYEGYKPITKERLRTYFYGKNGLIDELHDCLERLENGVRPVFQRPLTIFGDGGIGSIAMEEGCAADQEPMGNDGDKAKMREMIKSELKDILLSEDCRKKIKEILQH